MNKQLQLMALLAGIILLISGCSKKASPELWRLGNNRYSPNLKLDYICNENEPATGVIIVNYFPNERKGFTSSSIKNNTIYSSWTFQSGDKKYGWTADLVNPGLWFKTGKHKLNLENGRLIILSDSTGEKKPRQLTLDIPNNLTSEKKLKNWVNNSGDLTTIIEEMIIESLTESDSQTLSKELALTVSKSRTEEFRKYADICLHFENWDKVRVYKKPETAGNLTTTELKEIDDFDEYLNSFAGNRKLASVIISHRFRNHYHGEKAKKELDKLRQKIKDIGFDKVVFLSESSFGLGILKE